MADAFIEVDGERHPITIHAVPRAGGQWEGRALGADPFAPETTCDPGFVPSEVLVRVMADGREAAVAAVLAALRERFTVCE